MAAAWRLCWRVTPWKNGRPQSSEGLRRTRTRATTLEASTPPRGSERFFFFFSSLRGQEKIWFLSHLPRFLIASLSQCRESSSQMISWMTWMMKTMRKTHPKEEAKGRGRWVTAVYMNTLSWKSSQLRVSGLINSFYQCWHVLLIVARSNTMTRKSHRTEEETLQNMGLF